MWQKYGNRQIRFLFLMFLLAAGLPDVSAERLPMRIYTIADGLVHDEVLVIRQDSRRLLWFGTFDGLSWFDGHTFTSLTADDGLPHRMVTGILETRAGEIWLTTPLGLCRFDGSRRDRNGRPAPFLVYRFSDPALAECSFQCLLEAPDGALYVGTEQGLYRFSLEKTGGSFQPVATGLDPSNPQHGAKITQMAAGRDGSLWMATDQGIFRRWPDGRHRRYGQAEGLPDHSWICVLAGRNGWIWAGGWGGLWAIDPDSPPERSPVKLRYTAGAGLPVPQVCSLLQAADGRIWAGTYDGVVVVDPSGGPDAVPRLYNRSNGFRDRYVHCLAEDDDGNIWLGNGHAGACRINRGGFQLYTAADGLGLMPSRSILLDRRGDPIFCMTEEEIKFYVFRNGSFQHIPLPGTERFGWTGRQHILQDRRDEWWLAMGDRGLWRYPAADSLADLAGRKPAKVYTHRDGLPGDNIFCLYEDSRGDIWISLLQPGRHLTRRDRRTNRFETIPCNLLPACFLENRHGSLWIGFFPSGLGRWRREKLELFSTASGLPDGSITSIKESSQGDLWIGNSRNGAVKISNPAADKPVFQRFTMDDGLSSNNIQLIVEDHFGRIYFCTARGVDRMDPVHKTIRHFSSADGLPANMIVTGAADRQGTMWFGSYLGLSRYQPALEQIRRPPEILINGLRIGGRPYPVDLRGQEQVEGLTVPPGLNRMEFDFTGISFAPGDRLSYRYRLVQSSREWRHIPGRQTINYENLPPGEYRFEVEAINTEGIASRRPAVVGFIVLTPLWRQWWFITAMLLALGGLIFSIVRIRVRRRLELERVRTRIATDLHDDIGASLSQIAILSEVAVANLAPGQSATRDAMNGIAATARELVDSMSDIVWAINPQRDRLDDLVHRMRRFADDLLRPRKIILRFQTRELDNSLVPGADFRRQLYLIAKESLNNAVRHSGASEVEVTVQMADGWMNLIIADNGSGFDPSSCPGEGNGLASMHRRAAKLGGTLEVESQPGAGTRISCRVPAAGRWKLFQVRD